MSLIFLGSINVLVSDKQLCPYIGRCYHGLPNKYNLLLYQSNQFADPAETSNNFNFACGGWDKCAKVVYALRSIQCNPELAVKNKMQQKNS